MAGAASPVRFAVVGLGGMGQRHARNAKELGHEIVGGADVAEQNREEFAKKHDVPVFEEFIDLYETVEPDAIAIATPNTFHAPAAIPAFERDISVLVEKPIATTIDDAEAILEAAEASDGVGMVGFHNRFSPAMELLNAYRADGWFGDIVHVRTTYIRRRGVPNVNSWFTDAELAGGGALIDIGVHAIDFAMAAAGFPEPVEVTGSARQLYADDEDYVDPDGWADWDSMGGGAVDVEDSAVGLLRCADDTTIAIDVAWAADRDGSRTVEVQGTDGGARCLVGGEDVTLLGASGTGVDHYSETSLTGAENRGGYEREMEYFMDAVQRGVEPERNTISQAVSVQRVIHGIYQASETGQAYRFTGN